MKQRLKVKIALNLATWIAWVILAGATSGTSTALAQNDSPDESQGASVRVETLKTHSRMVFRINDTVGAEWKPSATGFELTLKGVGLSDLGAPLGEEEQWASHFSHLRDPRIVSLSFAEVAGGVRISGKWKFPSGIAALFSPKMETFDFRDKTSSSFIVDLWLKGGPTVTEVTSARKQADKRVALHKIEKEAKDRVARKLASEKARVEAEDVGRFCRLPLTESTDVILPFFPMHEMVNFSRWISLTTPDHRFYYFEPKTAEKDAQYVRLALDLYRQGKFALVLRTLDFLDSEYPKSSYRTEMRFLRANSLLKLTMSREAEELLVQIMNEEQDSAVALQSAMYIAAKRATQSSHLASLEPFLWLTSHHPEHRLSWLFHLGAAEAFYGMKQTELQKNISGSSSTRPNAATRLRRQFVWAICTWIVSSMSSP